MDNPELIGRILAGDPDAERELYDAHVDRVYRLAYRLSGDGDRAEDYTQETFIRAFGNLAKFRGHSSLSTWIVAIALSVIMNGLRKQRRIGQREVRWEEPPEIEVPQGGGMEPDLQARLLEAIDQLPASHRSVFVMHDLEGYTHVEIAASLGMRPGTSKAQLFRARAQLRGALASFVEE